jgi:hypothetical protein
MNLVFHWLGLFFNQLNSRKRMETKTKNPTKPPQDFHEILNRTNDLAYFESYISKFKMENLLHCLLEIIQNQETKFYEKFFESIYFDQKSSKYINLKYTEQFHNSKQEITNETLKLIQQEIESILNYLFQRFPNEFLNFFRMKNTEEWKIHIEEVYPSNLTPLFDEVYVKSSKRNILIQKHSFCEVIKKENSEKFFLKYVKGEDEVISGYLKEINSLKNVLKSGSHPNLLTLVDLFDEVNENNETISIISVVIC